MTTTSSVPPGVGNPEFPYHPLEPESIRLVRLQPWSTADDVHCSLSHYHDYYGQHCKYMALSYCWGDTSNLKAITLNGRPFHISANLWHAIAALHTHDAIISWWIDAICINQRNVVERNAQVQQMWQIFASALRVMIWLGPGTKEVSSPLLPPKSYSDAHDDEWEERAQQLRFLSNTEYFTRIWVVPEILNAPAINVMCGKDCMPWSALCLPIIEQTLDHLLDNQPGLAQLRRLAEGRYDVYGDDTEQGPHMQFMKVMYLFLIGDCWDVRDKIFALLGHPLIKRMGDAIDLRVDYRMSVEQLALAVIVQFHRLVWLRSPLDVGYMPSFFPTAAYGTLMRWLQDMLGMSFESTAFGEVLRTQITRTWPFDVNDSSWLLASMENEETIVLRAEMLLHVGNEELHRLLASGCSICSSILENQRAFTAHSCGNCSDRFKACDKHCRARQRLLRHTLRNAVKNRNQFCRQCIQREDTEAPPSSSEDSGSEDLNV